MAFLPRHGVLARGDWVRLRGLKARWDLNGCVGRLVRYDPSAGRWQLQLPAGKGQLRVRPENLEPSSGSKSSDAKLEAAWLVAWCSRLKPPTPEADAVAVLEARRETQVLAMALLQSPAVALPAASLALVAATSPAWRRFIRGHAAPASCASCGAPPGLPLRSLRWLQTARVYENFDGTAAECWKRWLPWGELGEDEPKRVIGDGAFRLELSRSHPVTVQHFGRGAQRWFRRCQPEFFSVRLCAEYGHAVAYVVMGDSTPANECGSRFGQEAVFMFVATNESSEPRLNFCRGRDVPLSVDLGPSSLGRWIRVSVELDWQSHMLEVSVDGAFVGEVPFRNSQCLALEHVTLLNYGGPSAASWSELVLE